MRHAICLRDSHFPIGTRIVVQKVHDGWKLCADEFLSSRRFFPDGTVAVGDRLTIKEVGRFKYNKVEEVQP
jgi:hypothetical protein